MSAMAAPSPRTSGAVATPATPAVATLLPPKNCPIGMRRRHAAISPPRATTRKLLDATDTHPRLGVARGERERPREHGRDARDVVLSKHAVLADDTGHALHHRTRPTSRGWTRSMVAPRARVNGAAFT